MTKIITTDKIERMLELYNEYNRPIFKKHTKMGCPVYFTTIDDTKRGRMQTKLVGFDVYSMELNNLSIYVNR